MSKTTRSTTTRDASLPALAITYHQVLRDRGWPRATTLSRTDPPVHTHYRQLLNRVFTAAKVRELTPRIEQIIHDLIDGFAGAGVCEFVDALLVHAHGDDDQPLSMGELQDLMHQLITGGFETTTGALATGMWLLLRYPEQTEMLRPSPT